jgi:hypothetical protein
MANEIEAKIRAAVGVPTPGPSEGAANAED